MAAKSTRPPKLARNPGTGPVASGGVRWTLLRASEEFGIARETIRRGLRTLGHEPGEDGCYSTRQIDTAIHGDLDSERARDIRASADLKEMDRAQRAGDLVPMSEVEKLYAECLQPIRDRFNSLPSECATLCNPTDPRFAREALQGWADEALATIRKTLRN